MMRTFVLGLLLVTASALGAQDYFVTAKVGVGDVVGPPYTQITATVTSRDKKAFSGRLVVTDSSTRRGGFMGRVEVSTYSQSVSIPAGAQQTSVHMIIPSSGRPSSLSIVLERIGVGGSYQPVATTDASMGSASGNSGYVAFVSNARLEAVQPYMFVGLVEVPPNECPTNWQAYSSFDAVILNSDALNNAQLKALIQYTAAGGTLVLSPTGAKSFNPNTPAARLLGIPAGNPSTTSSISDFNKLLEPIQKSGFEAQPAIGGGIPSAPVETPGSEEPPSAPPDATPMPEDLILPDTNASIVWWRASGRAIPIPTEKGLLSRAPVGAGDLVFIHTDISAPPFSTGGATVPTLACANLLRKALGASQARTAMLPLNSMASSNARPMVDIAGDQIPHRDILIAVVLAYVVLAGLGTFALARKLKRPELYPAGLLVLAILSVTIVFGSAELVKRTGDKVRTVRVVVSDTTSGQSGEFILGCAYVVNEGTLSATTASNSGLVFSELERNSGRGMPNSIMQFQRDVQGTQATVEVKDLERWQNAYFVDRAAFEDDTRKLDATSHEGALTIENTSGRDLKACVVVVSSGVGLQWHFVESLAAGDKTTLSASTAFDGQPNDLANAIAEADDERWADAFALLCAIKRDADSIFKTEWRNAGSALSNSGLAPLQGEFVLLARLPDDDRPLTDIEFKGVDSDDVDQTCVWAVRGTLSK